MGNISSWIIILSPKHMNDDIYPYSYICYYSLKCLVVLIQNCHQHLLCHVQIFLWVLISDFQVSQKWVSPDLSRFSSRGSGSRKGTEPSHYRGISTTSTLTGRPTRRQFTRGKVGRQNFVERSGLIYVKLTQNKLKKKPPNSTKNLLR